MSRAGSRELCAIRSLIERDQAGCRFALCLHQLAVDVLGSRIVERAYERRPQLSVNSRLVQPEYSRQSCVDVPQCPFMNRSFSLLVAGVVSVSACSKDKTDATPAAAAASGSQAPSAQVEADLADVTNYRLSMQALR